MAQIDKNLEIAQVPNKRGLVKYALLYQMGTILFCLIVRIIMKLK
jgi:hypothetical protein